MMDGQRTEDRGQRTQAAGSEAVRMEEMLLKHSEREKDGKIEKEARTHVPKF